MRATSIHTIELMRARLAYEHVRDALVERVISFCKKAKDSTHGEDVVLLVWIILVSSLIYVGYSKFAECGEIIGLYKQLRF